MNTVTIEINDNPVDVQAGTTILNAAKLCNVKIPALCFHPDLKPWAACGICVAACPYGAPGLEWIGGRQVCVVNTALCKGCGSCGAVCPSGAMQQLGFKEIQTLEMVNQALGLI